jgi:outer membrane protein assembly factor BamB
MQEPSMSRCIALILALPLFVHAADWPQWRGPDRDGKSATTGIQTDWKNKPPKLLWKESGFGEGFASVSMSADLVYTTGNRDGAQCVVAADRKTGKVKWSVPVTEKVPKHGYDGSRCTPSLDGDKLYVVPSDGSIVCLAAKTGKLLWKHEFKEWGGKMMSSWGFSESPLVDKDLVICTPGGKEALMIALNKTTGAVVWKTAASGLGEKGNDGAGYSAAVVSNACGIRQYVQLTGKGVIGVRASDGKLLWNYNRVANGTANIPTCIADGDHVFASTGYGTGAVLLSLHKAADGVQAKEKYFLDAKTFQNHHGGMVLLDGHIYAGTKHNEGFPTCLELKTGKVIWGGGEVRGAGSGSAAVLYVDGHLIFRYQSGEVALIKATPKGYELKGSFRPEYVKEPSWAHPVVVDGLLYLREQDQLMCYELK